MTPSTQALAEARVRSGVDRLDAQLLLARRCGAAATWLLAHPADAVDARHCDGARRADCRARADGVPLAYLSAERSSMGCCSTVTPDVLVPRPDTETAGRLGARARAGQPPPAGRRVSTSAPAAAPSRWRSSRPPPARRGQRDRRQRRRTRGGAAQRSAPRALTCEFVRGRLVGRRWPGALRPRRSPTRLMSRRRSPPGGAAARTAHGAGGRRARPGRH